MPVHRAPDKLSLLLAFISRTSHQESVPAIRKNEKLSINSAHGGSRFKPLATLSESLC
jgi:hypothetical protein